MFLTYGRHSLSPAHLEIIPDQVSEPRSCCSLDSGTAARREDIVFLVSQTELYRPREVRHQYDWYRGQGLGKQAGPEQEKQRLGRDLDREKGNEGLRLEIGAAR